MYQIIPIENNKIELREDFHSPQVYLDHWALNDFSQNPDLRSRFIRVMNDFGGTLRLSVANIVEFAKQEDRNQTNSMLTMIKSIDDCGLINVDPQEVINKENLLIDNPQSIEIVKNPSAELDIISIYLLANNFPKQWHVSDIISSLRDNLPSKMTSTSNDRYVTEMQRILQTGRNNPEHLHKAKARYQKTKDKGPAYQAPTRELFQLALDFVMRNTGMKMAKYSEWNDLFHLIVPVAYCDIVTLDKRWVDFMKQTGFRYPNVAMTFDKRSIDSFFDEIEKWNK